MWKMLWRSNIFSKDVTRWSVYLLKTSLFCRCFSNILPAQINYLNPKQHKYFDFKLFPSYSASLALQIGNALLIKQNIFYITIRWINMRLLYESKLYLFKDPFIKLVRSNKGSISPFLPPLRILTRVTSLKQVIYDFGRTPSPPVYVRYGWFLTIIISPVFILPITLLHPIFTLSSLIIREKGR